MNRILSSIGIFLLTLITICQAGERTVRARVTSPYHNIIVYDQDGYRILSFDGTTETRMSLRDPLKGHFEYTEYFHMPWLWNPRISRVLMIGLGGASVQRSFEHYYPKVRLETAEIDAQVRRVAEDYFEFGESSSQQVHLEDGRFYLRRSRATYDLIIADAYTKNRYGSSIPAHLTTREFFELVAEHLSTNGVMAYNVIGTLHGRRSALVGSIWHTMKAVFPEVYVFAARSSNNIVLIGVKSQSRLGLPQLRERARVLVDSEIITIPGFRRRLGALQRPPPAFNRAQLLTDDYAPVDRLMSGRGPE
jgi:spermidine synthase